MKIKTVMATYSLIIGIAMIGMWSMFYLTGSIPELTTEPMRVSMHILAEITTGILLIFSAWALFAKKKFAFNVFLISMGMLFYTLIASPGYYADRGNILFVGMFICLFFLTLVIVIGSMVKNNFH